MKHLCLLTTRGLLVSALLLLAASTAFAQPTGEPVSPGEGVELQQVDFLFPSATESNSAWGRMEVNPADLLDATGLSSGYLNLYTDAGWVVQNLVVEVADGVSPVVTYFDLGSTPPEDVTSLSARLAFSPGPIEDFPDGAREDFPVGGAEWNAEGADENATTATGVPRPGNLFEFIFGGAITKTTQPNAVNLQTAMNQCWPMAIANSLQYLEARYGIKVPHDHKVGLKGDRSLVGRLDKQVDRKAVGGGEPKRADGNGVFLPPMLRAKFAYLDANKLKDKLIHRHQGRGPGGTNAIPDGDFTSRGSTSKDAGKNVTFAWLCDQIKKGEDVEMVFSYDDAAGNVTGSHAVRIFECGTTLGVPWIGYLHDRLQTHQDAADDKGLENVRVFAVDTDRDGLLNLAPQREIRFVLAESVLSCEIKQRLGAPGNTGLRVRFVASAGIKSIRAVSLKNAQCKHRETGQALPVAFNCAESPPTAAEVDCRKTDNAKPAQIVLEMEDCDGNKRQCDPVITTLTGETPERFALEQNYPNPFNPTTTIRFRLTEATPVDLAVYDVTGRRIATLLEGALQAGVYTAEWDGRDALGRALPSGVYFYRLQAGPITETRAMTLLR